MDIYGRLACCGGCGRLCFHLLRQRKIRRGEINFSLSFFALAPFLARRQEPDFLLFRCGGFTDIERSGRFFPKKTGKKQNIKISRPGQKKNCPGREIFCMPGRCGHIKNRSLQGPKAGMGEKRMGKESGKNGARIFVRFAASEKRVREPLGFLGEGRGLEIRERKTSGNFPGGFVSFIPF